MNLLNVKRIEKTTFGHGDQSDHGPSTQSPGQATWHPAVSAGLKVQSQSISTVSVFVRVSTHLKKKHAFWTIY